MFLPYWPSMKGSRDINLGLDRVEKLLKRLGDPHKKLPPTIHIAGTNGKGSTLAYLSAILKNAGYKVHKYTSPHLVEFNERIVIDGDPISDVYLEKIIDQCEAAANQKPRIEVTFFEGVTVAAFLAFFKVKSDVLLLETGMGGRLDATNVVDDPLITIISSISMDHTEFLGKTIEKIAAEKAGIIKEDCPVITINNEENILEVLKEKADSFKNSPLIHLGKHFDVKINEDDWDFMIGGQNLKLPFPVLPGEHQIYNAALAVSSLYMQDNFKISVKNIKHGLKEAIWRGRIEKVNSGKLHKVLPSNYELYIDGGHNGDAAKVLSGWIYRQNMYAAQNGQRKPETYLICSMLKDKDSKEFFKYLSGAVDFVVCIPMENGDRSKKSSILAKDALNSGIKNATYSDDFLQAFEYIMAVHDNDSVVKKVVNKILRRNNNPARIIICGSLHLAGEFIKENE